MRVRSNSVFALLASVACLMPAQAQNCAGWGVATTSGPSPRQNHMLSSDGVGVLCFGGYNAGLGFNNETWRWDGSTWTLMSPASAPSARANTDMVYDSKRGRVVLFGGFSNPTAHADTWAWDGTNWTQLAPAQSPAGRYSLSMAYDAKRDRVVLFGGFSTFRHSDTWLFDGTNWTQATPAAIPPARNNHAMAYDPVRERVVMYGGYPGGTERLNDTWEWNGTNWTKIITPVFPQGRQYHDMEYNAKYGSIILSAGQAVGFVRLDDTWSYDGTAWTELSVTKPTPRDQHAIAYLASQERTVLVGGYYGGGVISPETLVLSCADACYPDCDADGALTIDDFICFQTLFALSDPYADCDGDSTLTIDDFICFQTFFAIGC